MKRTGDVTQGGTTPREIELKLAVSARELPQLRERLRRLGDGVVLDVDNTYYDTSGRLLRAGRMALRVRRIGGRWVQTLKTESRTGALSSRGEWEVPAPRGRLDVLRFPATPLAELLRSHPQAALGPVFRTRFTRTIHQADGGAIEVALDEGEIVALDRREPVRELELELKSGQTDALFRLALDLVGRGGAALALTPAIDSKAARGYRLAATETSSAQKANARAIAGGFAGDTLTGAALRGAVERGSVLLLANVGGIGVGADREFVHQARVAVRRVRSAARLLGAAAGWPSAVGRELRWIGRKLGAVRDWDVLQASTLPALVAALPDAAGPLAAQVAAVRRRDDEALQAALAGARFARLMLRLLRWAATPAADGPTLAGSARKRLGKLHRRLFDSAAFFVALPLAEQHRVRIRAKRLRYALDLYAAALPAKAAAQWVEHLARLQDELGQLNDMAVAAELLPRTGRAAGVDTAAALDWLAGQRQAHALCAEQALAQLVRLPVPWNRRRG